MELVEFLIARIDEDEAAAREASVMPYGDQIGWVGHVFSSERDSTRAQDAHIMRWDPARVLAECESKRRIVAEHPIYRGPRIVIVDSSGTDYGCELCHCIDPIRVDGIIEANGYCETLRLLALPYVDHSDYPEATQ